ncbi:hypothetical protein SERLA73DRAFT_172058 [Serpula lacrymans var. lacrymans S7.3]|uniref:Transcription factor IIIC 90kDa subunit N-terminal domain-containing protein n=2 Tax=Serpula lacrymans var. lacrymans TaxID=341189 RepID=F8QDV4_SERL3|nr:uncharacterized protein SERLADRAFT_454042 [Serpula lacrymans var. lacrymans S7.9]EGN93775.1 hypothetical protein SERLA73DRAFT_172058 [Serpula lacrymans var. lacrymans S7.3]EGO19144.1 hypothetical protein SERLADRAFT_454042 [Serpula lacrymans var. lacrymans S7.9]
MSTPACPLHFTTHFHIRPMSASPIYTALHVPTLTPHPSINCMQWSEDGQACFITKSAVHILTPDPGINFNTPADVKAPAGDEQSGRPLGWFKTMIETTRGQAHSWPEISPDWAATSLGSLDVSLRAVSCSPSNITSRGRCVLAVLNSNMEVSLWTTAKNHLKGEWLKIQDVTSFLLSSISLPESSSTLIKALCAQTMCISWSKQPNFAIAPIPSLDTSILALGNRAGSITLLRFNQVGDFEGDVSRIETIQLSERWITHLAWSPWSLEHPGQCESYLAYSTDDGGVGLVRVTQSLQLSPSTSKFGAEFMVNVTCEIISPKVCEADKRSITDLAWIELRGRSPILVSCTSGIIHLWSSPSPSSKWSGSRVLVLQTQKISVASSALYPVSGLTHVGMQDALVLSLFDGSFHVVHSLSINPSWSPPTADDTLHTDMLSKVSRSIFAHVTPGVRHMDVSRISGMASYDGFSTFIWVYEALRPADFSYKHEARHNSTFVTAPLWNLDDDTVFKILEEALSNVCQARGSAPIYQLRPTLLHLCKTGSFPQLCPRILEILHQIPADDTASIDISPWSGELVPELKARLRKSFKTHLFGWDGLLSSRMRLSVADLCWKLCKDPQMQAQCGQVAQILLNTISHRVLRILMHHFSALISILVASDVPFVLRIVVQSLLPGSPLDLSAEAQRLSASVSANVAVDPTTAGLHELCPACHVEVPLQDITAAICPNGHTWARCSVTSFILSTPVVRTCIGCSRKALLSPSQSSSSGSDWLPVAARSWIVTELLEAVQRCLFCGNSFVCIV